MALATASSAFDGLTDDERQNVRVIFVSVDYEHDKPQEVSEYAKSFHKDFIGITGNKQQIDNTIDLFPAGYAIQNDTSFALGYSIAHTDKIFFLDKDGKKIDEISEPRNSEDIITKIRKHP